MRACVRACSCACARAPVRAPVRATVLLCISECAYLRIARGGEVRPRSCKHGFGARRHRTTRSCYPGMPHHLCLCAHTPVPRAHARMHASTCSWRSTRERSSDSARSSNVRSALWCPWPRGVCHATGHVCMAMPSMWHICLARARAASALVCACARTCVHTEACLHTRSWACACSCARAHVHSCRSGTPDKRPAPPIMSSPHQLRTRPHLFGILLSPHLLVGITITLYRLGTNPSPHPSLATSAQDLLRSTWPSTGLSLTVLIDLLAVSPHLFRTTCARHRRPSFSAPRWDEACCTTSQVGPRRPALRVTSAQDHSCTGPSPHLIGEDSTLSRASRRSRGLATSA